MKDERELAFVERLLKHERIVNEDFTHDQAKIA